MKLIDIVNSSDALIKLAEKDLPIQTSFKVSDILFKIDKEINNYNLQKNKLIKKYGTSDNGVDYNFTEENRLKLKTELDELHDTEIDITFEKIKLPSDIVIAPKILFSLKEFIEREVV